MGSHSYVTDDGQRVAGPSAVRTLADTGRFAEDGVAMPYVDPRSETPQDYSLLEMKLREALKLVHVSTLREVRAGVLVNA